MSRVLWKGAIVFGLVNIPVSLYSGSRSGTIDFDYLDKRDMAPVGYQRINKRTGKPVDWDDIVKGYQYEKGEYVVLGDEDFRLANPKATQSVEILHFVDQGSIAPEYFDTPYRLAPDKRGEKGYALLRDTLKKTGKIGIAQVVIRTRQHLAALRPEGDALLLDTLRYADELLDPEEFELPRTSSVKVTAKEQEMAQRLVEDMSAKWKPEEYGDTYRKDLMARIKEKVKAGETELIPEAPKRAGGGAQVIDLMAALQKSLAQRTGRDAGGKAERAPAKKRAAHAGSKASRSTTAKRRKRA